MTDDELNAGLNASTEQWETLRELRLQSNDDNQLFVAVGDLDPDDLRFMVMARVLLDTQDERWPAARRLLEQMHGEEDEPS